LKNQKYFEALRSRPFRTVGCLSFDRLGYDTVRLIQSRYAADPSAMVYAVISGLSQG
jgi:hypothetical protein